MEKFEVGDVVRFKTLNELKSYTLNDDDNIYLIGEGVGMDWEAYVRCLTATPFRITEILHYHVEIANEDGINGQVFPQFITHVEEITEQSVKSKDAASEQITSDDVNHPLHYADGQIEVIDFIEDKQLNFHRGNAIKYIARAGKKNPDKEVEDLKKAVWYLNREIQRLEVQK